MDIAACAIYFSSLGNKPEFSFSLNPGFIGNVPRTMAYTSPMVWLNRPIARLK